jgi:hypothetical protein
MKCAIARLYRNAHNSIGLKILNGLIIMPI